MQSHLLLTVSSQDKPGVVESLSSAIESCGGNWLESRLAHLAGKFVGVIHVGVDKQQIDELKASLAKLKENGIDVSVEMPVEVSSVGGQFTKAKFSAVGPDRTGIVKEISSAFVQRGINVEELETKLSSMPYSGSPIFEAQGMLSVPSNTNMKQLMDKMDAIANDLGLDLELSQQEIK